jgi:hypothetical protein
MAAGPNALRGSGPNREYAFKDALTQAGSPNPRNDRICVLIDDFWPNRHTGELIKIRQV